MTGQEQQPDVITIQYVEQATITVALTLDQAREVFGLGGTADEYVGSRIDAIAKHTPSVLSLLTRRATERLPYSWTLQKLDDPWGEY